MPLTQLQPNGQPFTPGVPDVQRTSFSIDVLGRFVCSTFEEATTNPDFDVVVIGGGMYGGYCAAKLHTESAAAGRPLRVLVLEAGPFLVAEHGQNIPDLGLSNPFRPVIDTFSPAAQQTRDLVWGVGWRGNTGFSGTAYCVGGKSIYWGGWCPRLRDADLAQWPAEARAFLTKPPAGPGNLPNRKRPDEAPQSAYGAVEFEVGVKPADDFVFDPVNGGERQNGTIGLNEALRRRAGAAIADLGGALDGTALGPPEDPPIAVQTQSFVSGVFSPDKYSSLTLLMAALRSAQGEASGNSPVERDASRRLFLVPNAHVVRLVVPPVPRDGAAPDGHSVSAVELVVDGARRFLPIKPTCTVVLALGCIESTRPEVARRLAAKQDRDKISVVFRACGEMRADAAVPVGAPGTSWIDLPSPADRDRLFDHARAFVHYTEQAGAPIWRRMEQACAELAQAIGGTDTEAVDRHEVGSTWHASGTLCMGDDPALSVTDASGHFHHIANAACVDQAIFPTVGSANPVLTGLCLSRKAAETIVRRHVGEPDLTAAQIAAEEAEGFEFLLRGANAARWTPNDPRLAAGRPALIENGTILEVHGDAGLGVLFFDGPQPFGDFELRLQWKAFLAPGPGDITANSGVFLRAPRPGQALDDAGFYDRAVEIQIDDTGYDAAGRRFRSPLHRTGAIYGHAPARCHAQKAPSQDGEPGAWNEYRITAQGRDVSVVLNGRLCSEGEVPAALAGSGFIGFQYHTGKAQFRAVRVRRL